MEARNQKQKLMESHLKSKYNEVKEPQNIETIYY
jgi:hypothetical protein